ncbi:MAG: hypothetical protein K9M82_06800, partial [Deltaproteobacteria bacterium]|nr:hypothetical protein [Deltaproteobacteria bacterium]
MISDMHRHYLRAIPAIAAGIPLLLLSAGCQPKLPPEKPAPEAKAPAEERFEQALQYERLGELERAYEAYADYVRTHPGDEGARRALYRMAEIRYGDRRFEES